MIDVLLTVDVELWPVGRGSGALRRHVHGRTTGGELGLRHQLGLLEEYGLAATCFVESLFPCVLGLGPLRDIVALITSHRQEVALHVHPEWALETPEGPRPALTCYPGEQQRSLIERARDHLHEAGADGIGAFRAGSWAANFATLRALASLGIPRDSSHDLGYLGRGCELWTPRPLQQPTRLEGVIEVPVTCIRSTSGRLRHLQLGACSFAEIRHALEDGSARGYRCVVLVWHGGELVDRSNGRLDRPRQSLARRFHELCRFLAEHRDRFPTRRISDLDLEASCGPPGAAIPARKPALSVARRAQDLVARWI